MIRPAPLLRALVAATTIATICVLAVGCQSTGKAANTTHNRAGSPYGDPGDIPPNAARDTVEAQRLTQQAAAMIESDPAQAESLLRDALQADLFHGPAHNNLGVVHLNRGELYEAASEFEWARKLMPGHPSPRMNLAFTLEQAGRTDDAIQTYETALEVYPNHLPTVQAMTRLLIMDGADDERIPEFLSEISLRSRDPAWREWATKQMTRHD